MWGIVRRVIAGIGFVLAVAGFIVFAGAAIGAWWAKAEANRRTEALATKANTAVNAGDHAVTFVRGVIDQGYQDLDRARKTTNDLPHEPTNPFFQAAAIQASRNLAGSVERANAAVVTASDAAVVAQTALELFEGDEELKRWFSVQPEHLAQTRTDLGNASNELKSVRTLLGIPVTANAHPTIEQLVTVESALGRAREFVEQMARAVGQARQRVAETKRAADEWVLRIAIGTTAIGALGAMGQFFMARACWRALRSKPVPA